MASRAPKDETDDCCFYDFSQPDDYRHRRWVITRMFFILWGQPPNRGMLWGTLACFLWVLPSVLTLVTGDFDTPQEWALLGLTAALTPPLTLPVLWIGLFFFLKRQPRDPNHAVIPWYYDIYVYRILIQVYFGVGFVGAVILLVMSLVQNLQESRLSLDFGVFQRRFNAAISEGIAFNTPWPWVGNLSLLDDWRVTVAWLVVWGALTVAVFRRVRRSLELRRAIGVVVLMLLSMPLHLLLVDALDGVLVNYLAPFSMTRALLSGFSNTIRVVLASVVATTLLGIFLGIGLLSRNYLVRNLALIYTEIFRNTPLLAQIIFIYQAFLILLPPESQGAENSSLSSPDRIGPFRLHEDLYSLNAQGLRYVRVSPTESANWFFLSILVGAVGVWALRRWRLGVADRTGQPARTWALALPLFGLCVGAGWLASGG
ncbi:MAG: ABC transporter permease subunit [Anaerolineae bacterium]|nr:ABC transporter permease subunit [Anaerolineae bacterium]